jgi:hypothetical protein
VTTGKLYRNDDGQLIGSVEYKFQKETDGNWWGELVFTTPWPLCAEKESQQGRFRNTPAILLSCTGYRAP